MSHQPNDSLWIPAAEFQAAGTGTPTIVPNNRRIYQTFDPTTSEAIGTTLWVPSHWKTYDAYVWWNQVQGAVSGNVVWRLDIANDVAAGAATAFPTAANSTVTDACGAQYVVVATLVRSTVTPDSTKGSTFVLLRIATDAGDTLAYDAYMMGLKLLRTS